MEGLFPEVGADNNWCQVLVITGLYGYVLFNAANMIGDGAELLLLVPSLAPLVGSIVLPILGAVPDGLMVLFSGLGERGEAISQLSVGMGAMAGSTVMLLTMPWFLSCVSGRVNLDENGQPTYIKPKDAPEDWQKLTNGFDLFHTGVAIGDAIRSNAILMMCTCSTYLIIQVPSWIYDDNEIVTKPKPTNDFIPQWFEDQAAAERIYAWASLAACLILFFFYLYKMYRAGCSDKAASATVQGIQNGDLTIWGAMQSQLAAHDAKGLGQKLLAEEDPAERERLKLILKPFFGKYDEDNSGEISQMEFIVLLRDLRVMATFDEQLHIFKQADKDKTGTVDFEEFVDCVLKVVLGDYGPTSPPSTRPSRVSKTEEADDEDEEEDEMPEDLASLSPAEQQKRLKIRAFQGMGLGTLLVLVFSDPMCDMLGVIGDKMGVPKFYVAFVLAPLASNASELIAAMKLASKKTAKSMVDSLSSLEGAGVMNNTFCMGIFLFLILKQNLAFTYKAETVSIIAVELLIGALALKSKTMRMVDACIVFCMYPFCLLLVLVLENAIGLD